MIAKNGRLSLTEAKILERIITYGLEGVSLVAPKFIDSTDERIEQGAKHETMKPCNSIITPAIN